MPFQDKHFYEAYDPALMPIPLFLLIPSQKIVFFKQKIADIKN